MSRNIEDNTRNHEHFFTPNEKTEKEAEEDPDGHDDGLHFIHYLSEEE